MRTFALALSSIMALSGPAFSQMNITTMGVPATQNFNGMGITATGTTASTLPAGFRVSNAANAINWDTGLASTTNAGGTSGTGVLTSSSAGAAYNFAAGVMGSATDRSLGFLLSSSYARNRSIILKLHNGTGAVIGSLDVAFDYEKYRNGTLAVSWAFFHGPTSSPALVEGNGDFGYGADAVNTVVNPAQSQPMAFTISGLNIASGADYYLRWTYTTTTNTNAKGLGLDNFSVTANPPPPPANDECSSSEYIPTYGFTDCQSNSTPGSTAYATASGGSCGAASSDVWYYFYASTPITFVRTQPITAGGLGIEVFDACGGSSLSCSSGSFHTLALPQDQYYYFRVYTATPGTFDVCVSQPLTNDECNGADYITNYVSADCPLNASSGTTLGATASGGSCGATNNDVWYYFNAGNSLFSNIDLAPGTASGLGLEVFDACGGTSVHCAGGSNHAVPVTPGQNYWMRVYSSTPGSFTVCVSNIVQPANDDCAGVTYIGSAQVYGDCPANATTGTTIGASASGGDCGATANDVWYYFYASSSAHTFVELVGISASGFGIQVYEWDGCVNAVSVYCAAGASHTVPTQNGQLYGMRVYTTTNGDFTVCVNAPQTNDDCDGAQNIGNYDAADCPANATTGTTLGSTPSGGSCGASDNDVWYYFYSNSSLFSNVSLGAGTTSGLGVEVFDACGGTSVYCAGGSNHAVPVTPGQNYWMRVYSSTPGSFTACVSNIVQPANDDCAGVTYIGSAQVYGDCPANATTGTTIGASASGGDCGATANDVWYYFYASSSAHTFVDLGGISASGIGIQVYEWDGCVNAVSVYCAAGATHTVPTQNGQLYGMRVYTTTNGEFTVCVSAPQPNDECTNATYLGGAQVFGTCPTNATTGNTSGTTVNGGSCGGTNSDVWFYFSSSTGTATFIDLVAVTSSGLGIEVYEDACGGTGVYCANGSAHTVPTTTGHIYYVRVHSAVVGEFTICVNASQPNDECMNPVGISLNAFGDCPANGTEGSTLGATASGGSCANSANDVWYRFYTYGQNTTALVDLTADGASGLGIELFEYDGSCTGASVYCATGLHHEVPVELNVYYELRVYSTTAGGFSICLTTPAQNDICSSAIGLSVYDFGNCAENGTAGTTEGALPYNTGSCGPTDQDVWYTAYTNNHTRLHVDLTSTGATGLGIDVFDACDGASVYCGSGLLHTIPVVPNTSCYIRVHGTAPGGFTICVSQPPANDDCAGAEYLNFYGPGTCPDNAVAGTTVGATSSTSSGCAPGTADVWYYPYYYYYYYYYYNQGLVVDLTSTGAVGLGLEAFDGCSGASIYCATGLHHVVPYLASNDIRLRVYSTGAGGFTICTSPAVANNECAYATPITLNLAGDCPTNEITGSTIDANAVDAAACNAGPLQDVWFSVYSNSATAMSLDLTAQGAAGLGLQVFDACGGNSVYCANGLSHTFLTQQYTTYWLKVYTATAGDFTICATQAEGAVDCEGLAGGPALPGTACDDGNPLTLQDLWLPDCSCGGYDCANIVGGPNLIGTPCSYPYAPPGITGVWNASCGCDYTNCAGEANVYSNYPGTYCDDGDPLTINETYQADCSCGQGTDCAGVVGGTNVTGTPCQYPYAPPGLVGTWNSNCGCDWINCAGEANIYSNYPGTYCDDGDPLTINETYQADCSCGQGTDCAGVVGGTNISGSPCQYPYGPPSGVTGSWNASCQCDWIDCTGTAQGYQGPGSSCDDGNAVTVNDQYQPDCSCQGYDCNGVLGGPDVIGSPCLVANDPNGVPFYGIRDVNCGCTWNDCQNVVDGPAYPGQACDDGLASPYSDALDISCTCRGYDCAGVYGGTALTDNCSTCVGGTTGQTACVQDCHGDFGGTAYLDNCSTCVGGNTGLQPCTTDCNGVPGGTAFLDNCNTCVGGNTGLIACTLDCNSDYGGTAFLDNCNTCVGGNTGIAACTQDCNGDFGGTASLDNCGTCVGGNTGLTACIPDCNGDFGGTASLDNCGTCVGGNTGLTACVADCNGEFGGMAFTDNCGNCVGGSTGELACTADCNGEFGGTAYTDNCGNCVGGSTGELACFADCNGEFGGTAYTDNCGNCVGGSTGEVACTADCNGVFGGTAYLDNCSTCVGGNTGLEACAADCNGDLGGTAFYDNCATCVGGNTGLTACVADCHGDFGGTASIDACSVCSGGNTGVEPNSACLDCAGVPNGTSILDACGTCRLPNDPAFVTAVRTLTFTGNGNFQNAVLFPQTGEPSTTYTAEVIYTDPENGQLPLGYPRLILDYEGDGVFNGPFDRTVLMVASDLSDVTTTDGKRYRCTVVGLPTGSEYQTRIQVANGQCITQVGPFNYPDVLVAPDLEIFANDIWFSEPHPEINSPITVYARVNNRSDFAAEGFAVHLLNEFAPSTIYPDITLPYLGPRDTLTVSWDIITPNEVAWCPMRVTVDASNVITETDELNNNAVRPFVNGDYNVPGSIHVYASVDPAVSVIQSPSDIVVVSGYAYYSGTAVVLADSSVAGATVTINGHYGETYIALTNSEGYFSKSILAPGTIGLYEATGEVTDYTLTGQLNSPYERIQGCPVGFGVYVSIDQVMFINGYAINAILEGGSISGNITVYNSTCADVTIPTRLDISQTGGLPILGDVIVPPLVAGGSFTLPYSGIVFDTPGTYSLCGTSDADYELNDLNYHSSHCAQLTVFPALPDIVPYYQGGIGEAVPQCNSGEPSFNVQNTGAVPSGPFNCEVDVYRDGNFEQIFSSAVNNIDPFSNISFSIPYVPPAIGAYTFDLRCDVPLPNGTVAELNETNNTATYTGSTVACQADLGISYPCDLPVTPVDPTFPGTATYHAVIGNYGNATAQGPIDVTFEVSTGGTYSVQYAGDLAPGESTSVEVTAPTVAPATASLTATVDLLNTIPEFNEGGSTTDNLCWEYTLAPDWDCGQSWYWPQLPVLGQTSYVAVTLFSSHLYNASELKVRFQVSGPDIVGTALLGDVIVDNAGPHCWTCGVGVTLPGSFLFSSEGTYHFTFTVDPDSAYTECDEGNNVLTRDIVITNLPDLRVLSQYINPSLLNPDVNEPVTLDVTYENIGYGNLGSTFDLKVLANNDELATVANVPGLVTGGTNTVSIPVPFSSPLVGVHVFRAIIDALDEVVEGDELNNEATRAIVVGAAANLYFASFTANTTTPNIGQLLSMQAAVGNNGDLPIAGEVYFYYVNAALDTIQIGPSSYVSLDSSETVVLNRAWTVTEQPRAMIARIRNASALEFTYSDNEARFAMGALVAQLTSVPGCTEGPLGSLTAQVFGGVAPYTYEWTNDSTGSVLSAVPGSYSVVIMDSEGRVVTVNGTIAVASGCGLVLDCNGDLGGTAFIDNCATCVGGNTGEVACVADCNGDFGGTAFIDNCATCVGGNTGEVACVADCNGDIGGSAFIDNCATCVGGNTGEVACVADCNGDFGGTAFLDNCATCVGGNTGLTACIADCNGDFGGTAFLDNCATCVGGNTGEVACVADCNGDFGGTAIIDNCATCVGGNTGEVACIADCNGDFGGSAFLDNCGTCVGGNTGEVACVADCNGDFGGTAFIDGCETCVGGNTGLDPCNTGPCTLVINSFGIENVCDPLTGTYNANITLIYTNAPATGSLLVNGTTHPITGSPQTVSFQLGEGPVVFTAAFTADNSCALSSSAGTTLVACPQDCNGVYGGTAFMDGCEECVGGNTGLDPCPLDCSGVFGGTAYVDNCNTCVGGTTGLVACVQDCNGEFGGTAFLDGCGICVGGNTGLVPGNPISLTIQTDGSSTTTWDVREEGTNAVVASGGMLYSGPGEVIEIACLANGCYTLRVFDDAGDGITGGGYVLRSTIVPAKRIIDDRDNFGSGSLSAISGDGAFCLPLGGDDLIAAYCDKLNWVNYQYVVCGENTAVSASWVLGGANNVQPANSGYEFWFFDPNGSYSYRVFRSHNVSDGFSPATATRACHMKINAWYNSALTPLIPQNKLLNVRVRGRVNGVNAAFGPTCRFKLDPGSAACPMGRLLDTPGQNTHSCGVTRKFGGANSATNRLYAKPAQFLPAVAASLVRYQFRFRNAGLNVCIVRPPQSTYILHMNWNAASGPPLICGVTYQVDVRMSKDGGSTWCFDQPVPSCSPQTEWGPICDVTIQACSSAMVGQPSGVGVQPSLSLYPNPSRGDRVFLNIEGVATDVDRISVDVFDLRGARVVQQQIAWSAGASNTEVVMDRTLVPGVYMVHVQAGEQRWIERLVVQQ